MLAGLSDRFPALEGWMRQVQALLDPVRVVLVPSDDALTLTWSLQGEPQVTSVPLPQDLVRAGVPLQREVLGDTLADLLLDQGLVAAQVEVELLLPLPCCEWRRLQGAAAATLSNGDDLRALGPDLGWSLSLQESYLDLVPDTRTKTVMVVGAERMVLQAWLDTLAAADLSVRRAEWLLCAAWRGLACSHEQDLQQPLIWLVEQGGSWRLLLLEHGWPELDVALEARDLAALRVEVLGLVDAWREQNCEKGSAVMDLPGWCVTADAAWKGRWGESHDALKLGPLLGDAEMSLVELALMAPAELP
ncbi:hypothetical protein [Synechococcus sp. PROS-7-1]|uniref:hypothetical protein n=1 Tax=Synechococcus sp. PROS-7-1 TaxID=1442556 RepID=UPI0021043BBF|nr:hypothetical protein [Synechococcus sp. PROS-7-1]